MRVLSYGVVALSLNLLLGVSAFAESCDWPSDDEIGSAGQALAALIQPSLAVKLDPSSMHFKIMNTKYSYSAPLLQMSAVDGTVFNIDGNFSVVPEDRYDSEGNIVSCDLVMRTSYDSIIVREVNNANTGFNVLKSPIQINQKVVDFHISYLRTE